MLTLFQLRNLINWRNVAKDPSKRVAVCEEFFLLVVAVHILTAAMQVFGMSSLEDRPSVQLFPANFCELSPVQRRQLLLLGIQEIVKKFVDVSYPLPLPQSQRRTQTVCVRMPGRC